MCVWFVANKTGQLSLDARICRFGYTSPNLGIHYKLILFTFRLSLSRIPFDASKLRSSFVKTIEKCFVCVQSR